ncbi:hypothetical protein PG985_003325 [Apiospora marii]|uniref:uncharacterized protein n=1 Tax=Apiospora marii TaxID=335849 RepID=UPI00312E19E5
MSHSPMVLTLESAKTRRQEILKVATDECALRGCTANRASQEILPTLISQSEIKVLTWMVGLEETDDRRHAAMAGFIAEDYIAWAVDACLWHKLQDDKCHDMPHIQAAFSELYFVPQQFQPPWTNWVRETVEVEEISRSNKMKSLMAQSRLLRGHLTATNRRIGQMAKEMKRLQAESDRIKGELHGKEAGANQLAIELEMGPATWFYS